jgi:hypothetical protein
LDLTDDLLAFSREQKRYAFGFGELLGAGHFNYDGHRVATEAITEFLIEKKLVPVD